jgi:hypothetical protein
MRWFQASTKVQQSKKKKKNAENGWRQWQKISKTCKASTENSSPSFS